MTSAWSRGARRLRERAGPARLKRCVGWTRPSMRIRRFLFVAVTIAASVDARASCPGPLTLDDQFARSSTVFVGRVIRQRVAPSADRGPATETTLEAERIWKGERRRTIVVRTCGWAEGRDAVTCSDDVRFRVGARYVVFASGHPLQTSDCQPTQLFDDAQATIRWLATKPDK
jgi:hypothetical protein